MKKFISLVFLAYVLLYLIAVSTALPTDDELTLNKRNSYLYKRNVLGKRKKDKVCHCALAEAIFSGGPVKGLVIYAQDESGDTTVTGQFSKGFKDKSKYYSFLITDDSGVVIRDLTSGLNVQFTDDEGTEPFRHKFNDFNLNCDNDGILFTKSSKPETLSKSESGSYMRINEGGDNYAQADINEI